MTIVGPLLVHTPPSYGIGHLVLEKGYNNSCPGVPTAADPPPSRGWWSHLKKFVHIVVEELWPIPPGVLFAS